MNGKNISYKVAIVVIVYILKRYINQDKEGFETARR
jgi:hypothetical protein